MFLGWKSAPIKQMDHLIFCPAAAEPERIPRYVTINLLMLMLHLSLGKQALLLSGIVTLVLNFLFVGVYRDWSDGDLSFFFKYRPSIKSYFYSPERYYRLHPQELSSREKEEEFLYREFCQNFVPNGPRQLPVFVSIQVGITMFMLGLLHLLRPLRFRILPLFIHYVTMIWLTSATAILMLFIENCAITIGAGIVLIAINYFAMILMNNFRIRKKGHKP